MDKIEQYRQIICNLLTEYAQIRPVGGEIESETVFDLKADRYLLLHLGWNEQKRIYSVVFHLDITCDKIWIQCNQTDHSLTDDLVTRGIHREDIIIGSQPPYIRQYLNVEMAS